MSEADSTIDKRKSALKNKNLSLGISNKEISLVLDRVQWYRSLAEKERTIVRLEKDPTFESKKSKKEKNDTIVLLKKQSKKLLQEAIKDLDL